MSPMRTTIRRGPRLAAVIVILGLVAVACGTRVDEATLQAASGGSFGSLEGQGQGGVAGLGTEAGGSALTGDEGSAGQALTGQGTGTGSGGGSGSTSGGGGGGSGPTKSEIVLGYWGTASGIVGSQLKSVPVATRAWAADVNARGGLNGHPVRLIYGGDDGGDPGKSLEIGRRLIEEYKVLALFNSFGLTTSHVVVPYAERHNVPWIGDGSGGPWSDESKVIFNVQNSNKLAQGRSYLTPFLRIAGVKKLGLLYCRESATCANGARQIKAYAPTVGAEIVYETQMSFAQPDYTAEVLEARRAGAEGVISYADWATALRVARSAHRQSWNPPIGSGSAMYEQQFIDSAGEDGEGMTAYSRVAPWTAWPVMRDYLSAIQRYQPGSTLGDTGATYWVHGKFLERVGQSFGDKVTRGDIFDAIYALRDETLGGRIPPITFPRKADRARVNLCTVPVQFRNGTFRAPMGVGTFVCHHDDGLRIVRSS